jgi:prophage antirepressor-like protein
LKVGDKLDLINFNGNQVSILNRDGTKWDGKQEAWFIPKQIAEAIGASDPRVYAHKILNRNPEKFKGFIGVTKMGTPGGIQEITIINENGLYMFLLVSDLPDAVQFQRKITHLLKKVRAGEVLEQVQIPASVEDMIIMQAQSVKELKKEVKQIKDIVDHEVWITEHQKQEIRDAVGRRVYALREEGYEVYFQTLYSALKRHFRVAKYDKIPRKDFSTSMRFLSGWFPPVKKEKTSGCNQKEIGTSYFNTF